MIINTGMRTDIPAFYSEWLMNRIHEGFVYVRNPYYRFQVSKYSLSSKVVDCLAFCTKNPYPMLKYLDELKEQYLASIDLDKSSAVNTELLGQIDEIFNSIA